MDEAVGNGRGLLAGRALVFGGTMHEMRVARGLTLRALARMAHVNPGYLSRIEAGRQVPSAAVAVAIDRALDAGGALVRALRAGRDETHDAVARAAVRESTRLSGLLDGTGRDRIDGIGAETSRLAVTYLTSTAGDMLTDVVEVRRLASRELGRSRRRTDVTDLASWIGHLSGILAYAALDLGHPDAALTHAGTAWSYAEASGDDRLRAWARGTQSLIVRFGGDYPTAIGYAEDGLRYAGAGTSRERLLCGVAQCRANLGDGAGAHRALATAWDVRGNGGPDGIGGLFAFSAAKQAYYSASSLIWLDGRADAREARREAERALALWSSGDPRDRSLDDEALAQVYAATASVQLGEVDAAAAFLAPVLDLPTDRRISWLRKRVSRVSDLLTAPRFAGSPTVSDLHSRLTEYR